MIPRYFRVIHRSLKVHISSSKRVKYNRQEGDWGKQASEGVHLIVVGVLVIYSVWVIAPNIGIKIITAVC